MLGWAAMGCIVLFYLFSLLCALLLLLVIGCDLILILIALRVGLAAQALRFTQRHVELLKLLLRSLWLSPAHDQNVVLQRGDAPRLFDLVEKTSIHIGIAPPQTIVLLMGVSAWILLPGVRRSTGKTAMNAS